MKISKFDIQNFRKLVSVRIDISDETTLFVGANNSGKTSAMVALRQFLVHPKNFAFNDFSVEHWPKIKEIGRLWLEPGREPPTLDDLAEVIPSLDIWLDVRDGEFHYVSSIIPNLDWAGGSVGVRLRFEPKDVEELWRAFVLASKEAIETKAAFKEKSSDNDVKLWPTDFLEFLSRELRNFFTVRTYVLDPQKIGDFPQSLDVLAEPVEGTPIQDLIRINEIGAQRGFSDDIKDDEIDAGESTDKKKLSAQLRRYYDSHLNPLDRPGVEDLGALQAIEAAQKAFDERLKECFEQSLGEVQNLGYPGVFDPKITISTKIRPTDGLDHQSAVQYKIDALSTETAYENLHLPEHYNGLGYQNLISMVFRLLSFRSAWMRDGKARKDQSPTKPLHLVLIEEPEAHLHVQVQQVFMKKAYSILRNHDDLRDGESLTTQLIVSTHSSHIAHELEFSSLRYFRRIPAGLHGRNVPTTSVVNLSDVFGGQEDTKRFVTRYLRTQHCDLFFADAAILVEGPAEKMLVPNFIRYHFGLLNQSFTTLLEIGGSHAHRLKPLIDRLGLLTLVITDLDAVNENSKEAELPIASSSQETANASLKQWHPKKTLIKDLQGITSEQKVLSSDELSEIRMAYQVSIKVSHFGKDEEVMPSTFEDALVLENIDYFKSFDSIGLAKKFSNAIAKSSDAPSLAANLFAEIRVTKKKAEFALDVLEIEEFKDIVVPTYISEGLQWLTDKLKTRLQDQDLIAQTNESSDITS